MARPGQQAEVEVASPRARPAEAFVEAVQLLEHLLAAKQLASESSAARRRARGVGGGQAGAAGCRPAAQHVGVVVEGGQPCAQPAGRGHGVVVGEGDERRAPRASRGCARRRPRAAPIGQVGTSPGPRRAGAGAPHRHQLAGTVAGRVVDHDDFVAPALERLAQQRIEAAVEQVDPAAGGDHDRHCRRGRNRSLCFASLHVLSPPVPSGLRCCSSHSRAYTPLRRNNSGACRVRRCGRGPSRRSRGR
jgi:hypothetical protein